MTGAQGGGALAEVIAEADSEVAEDGAKDLRSIVPSKTYEEAESNKDTSSQSEREAQVQGVPAEGGEVTDVNGDSRNESNNANPPVANITNRTDSEVEAEVVPEPTTITVEATAYVATCEGCIGITKTGVNVRETEYFDGKRIIAVDPNIIPLGTEVRVTLPSGHTFEATAQDIGGGINGNEIDILVGSEAEAIEFGRQSLEIEILN